MSLLVDIDKNFGDFRLQVSFEVEKETVGLLGASGCGKSMTLRCIAGIVTPDRGRIVLNGRTLYDSEKHIDLPPQKRHVGILFQNYALFPNMTVAQNVRMGLHRQSLPAAEQNRRVTEVMARLQLTGLETRRPAQLSGGQQQRVALARILVSEPEILMLDEPFSALDSFLRWKTEREVLRILQGFDGPALLVSHSRDEIYRVCDRVAVYDRGKIDVFDEKWALFRAPHTRSAALLTGCKNLATAKQTEEDCLYVPAWGLKLRTSLPISADVEAVGIRAHKLHPGTGENAFCGTIEEMIDGPFETRVYVRPAGAAESLCWLVNNAVSAELVLGNTLSLMVEPDSVLPLLP